MYSVSDYMYSVSSNLSENDLDKTAISYAVFQYDKSVLSSKARFLH